ncbi:MAG TPA: hypothetical protein VFG51_03510 [Candidatus Saccharimonadia bacterium]|nr:hypothetical protein [Candidatus Saccharimonadia bacterium]
MTEAVRTPASAHHELVALLHEIHTGAHLSESPEALLARVIQLIHEAELSEHHSQIILADLSELGVMVTVR